MTLDKSVFARIPALAALDPASIQGRSMDGHTNRMFALATPVGGFALRLPRPGAAAAVDRRDEQAVLRGAAALGIAPPPLFFDPTDGTMLTRLEPGRRTRERADLRDDPAAAVALGGLLRRLHGSDLQFSWTFRATEVVAAHFEKIAEPELARRLLQLADRLDRTVGRRVPAHDDVHAGNILWQGERPWLIDWEYAGMNDPAFDLATARIELDLWEPAFAALLQGWGRDDAIWRVRIEEQMTLAHGIAGAWYVAQGAATDDQATMALGMERLWRCAERIGPTGT